MLNNSYDRIAMALFCSGGGSNAEALMHRFARHPFIRVALVVVNKASAGAIARAEKFGVPVCVIDAQSLQDPEGPLAHQLKEHGVGYIALAGFLKKIPAWLLQSFPEKITNIHPSLLPKHGGPGMYGQKVHEAVLRAGDKKSGMSVHLIDQEYDRGTLLYQAECEVLEGDTAESLQQRVLALEHEFYGHVIESYVAQQEDIALG